MEKSKKTVGSQYCNPTISEPFITMNDEKPQKRTWWLPHSSGSPQRYVQPEDVEHLFKDLFKQAVEAMLEAEMTEHLGYEKHSAKGRNGGNSRNGITTKLVKTGTVGDVLLTQPVSLTLRATAKRALNR
jgi:hypothetical protein